MIWKIYKHKIRALLFSMLCVTLLSCSDSNPIFNEISEGREEIVSISITPGILEINESTQSQKLTVLAQYMNGSSSDITDKATWASSNVKVGMVTTSGYFQARDSGSTIISASYQEFVSNEVTVSVSGFSSIYVDGAYTGLSDGSKLQPFVTIGDALDHAKAIGARRINVAKGTYTESLVIDSDISLYGGYNPVYDGNDWTRDEAVSPADTVIQSKGTIAIQYSNGLTAATVLDGFRILGSSDTSGNSSIALFVQQASPTIQNNEIYGGTCSGISIGILNQTASPTIKDNAVISGGLPVASGLHTGGGSDNIAILNQSFSSPLIEGNGSEVSPSQVITGPTGGENTFRIKCESSSSPTIKNNKIEILTSEMNASNTVKGILAISSSPVIEGNTIASIDNTRLAIRGVNTSFQIKNGNSITGDIEIASNSVNPVLDGNSLIDGSITVTGTSTEVEIKNHLNTDSTDPDYAVHYGVVKNKIIKKQISFHNSSGLIQKIASDNIYITNQSTITIQDCFILSKIRAEYSNVYAYRNYIEVTGSSIGLDNITAISTDSIATQFIGNIINVTDNNAATGWAIGASFGNCSHITVFNNIFNLHTTDPAGLIHGIRLSNITWEHAARFSNNIFNCINASSQIAIYRLSDSYDTDARLINGNIAFSNIDAGSFILYYATTASPEALTVSDVNALNGVAHFNFSTGELLYTANQHYDRDSIAYSTFFTSYNETDFFQSNFRLITGSPLNTAGSDPSVNALVEDNNLIYYDFDGCTRNSVSTFSVGPYEYNIQEADRNTCVK